MSQYSECNEELKIENENITEIKKIESKTKTSNEVISENKDEPGQLELSSKIENSKIYKLI